MFVNDIFESALHQLLNVGRLVSDALVGAGIQGCIVGGLAVFLHVKEKAGLTIAVQCMYTVNSNGRT